MLLEISTWEKYNIFLITHFNVSPNNEIILVSRNATYRIFSHFGELLVNEVCHVVELLLHFDLGSLQAPHGLLSIC
jgi:hypothetical protein